jgi:CRISPR-associated exonuclease Cas4
MMKQRRLTMSLLEKSPSMPSVDEEQNVWWVRVTDLKQYSYCPRVPYYLYCLPHLRPTTYKMEAGIEAQEHVTELEERRSLRAYGLSNGERHFYHPVWSSKLGCIGQIDMVIEIEEGGVHRLIPVDYKLSQRTPGRHFQLQLACYAMMLEEMYDVYVPDGYIYLIQSRQAERIAITKRLRQEAATTVATLRAIIKTQRVPSPTSHPARCVACEYRRFCNDVL